MMRTVEILIVIMIITGAFVVTSFYAVLPWPRQVSPVNLRRLSLTTLQTIDSSHDLSLAAFNPENQTLWNNVQVALSASLPPNILYNLTVYDVNSDADGGTLYTLKKSIANAEPLGVSTDASSYLASSANVTFNVTPEKIGGGITLYILNCSDANGWWITGYNAQSLAEDLYGLLSPYFAKVVMVQSTAELGQILGGSALHGETVANAVVINTCGEAVPIPTAYGGAPYSNDGYAYYTYTLGKKVLQYNWTWVSIVGWPLYYVSNTALFSGSQNNWGIYGMSMVSSPGLNSFLQGLNNQQYVYGTSTTGSPGVVSLSNQVKDNCNYYGIYPSVDQTSTRALSSSILSTYNLVATTYVFPTTSGGWNAGAVYRHNIGQGNYQGGFFALGLTRTPDIRLTALGLLSDYKPRLYSSDYSGYNTSRLVVLQLGLVGGV
jgi:hypothetical protein